MKFARRLESDSSLKSDFFERMARAGALAPSGDNLQPWAFAVEGDTLLVKHDPARDRSLFNVRSLASYIALGAVLENIAIASSNDGYHTRLQYLPERANDDTVARVFFEPGARPDPLAAFIGKRCTNRRPYSNRPLPQSIAHLDLSKNFPKTSLTWIQNKTRLKELGRVISGADRLIFENPNIHRHLFSTLRWTEREVQETRDGLPIASLELGKLGATAFRALKNWSVVHFLNHLGFSAAAARHSMLLMQGCSAAGLLTAADTSPDSFLEAGRAFQRVWLTATQENLALQPMTAIIFLQLRSRLSDYTGLTNDQAIIVDKLTGAMKQFFLLPENRVPAMLFRIGVAMDPSGRTVRRPPVIPAAEKRDN